MIQSIKDLPLLERPREKLLHFGAPALSNTELLAILIGSGNNNLPLMRICEQLTDAISDQPARLAAMHVQQLCAIKGIGEIKAIALAAAIELGKRSLYLTGEPLLLATPEQAAAFLAPYLARQESPGYFLVLLNSRKELLATKEIPIRQKPPAIKPIVETILATGAPEMLLCRSPFTLPAGYLDREKTFLIQLAAAAGMLNIKMRRLLPIDNQPP